MSRPKTKVVYLIVVIACLQLVAAPEADAALLWHGCKPTEVAVWNNRVHIRCSTPTADGIEFFAVQIQPGNAVEVDRFLTLTTASITNANRHVAILYDPAKSGVAWECPKNCRPVTAYILK